MDAYAFALSLLSRRELSTKQLRDRLARRKFPSAAVDQVIRRLTADRTLDDSRVAVASARSEASIRRRGKRRVLQRVRQLGIDEDVARAAVDEVFADLDESALLDQAIARKLRGAVVGDLDRKAVARVVRALVAQGFAPGAVVTRLRALAGESRHIAALPDTEPSASDE